MIHPAILISTIVTIIGIIFIVIGLTKDFDGDSIGFGICIVLLSVLLGFGMLCTGIPWGEEMITYSIPDEIAKNEKIIFAKVDDKTIQTTEHSCFIADIKELRVKKTARKNAWGTRIEQTEKLSIVVNGETLEKK